MDSNKAQRQLIAEYVNNVLVNYEFVSDILPVTADNCIQQLHDGVLLSCIMNKISTSGPLINEATLKKTKATVFHKLDQINRALQATKKVGLNIVNIRAQNIVQKKQNTIIGLFNQIIKQKPAPKRQKKQQKHNPFYEVQQSNKPSSLPEQPVIIQKSSVEQKNQSATNAQLKRQQQNKTQSVPKQVQNINPQAQRQEMIRNLKINQNQIIHQNSKIGYTLQVLQGPQILVLSGSLRHGSVNRGMVRSLQQIKTRKFFQNMHFIIPDLSILPLYNHDIVSQGKVPKAVHDLRQIARKSLGILIATPEYNGTFSGIIKNAFDWLSDSFDPSPLTEKKIGIVSASYLTQNQIRDTIQMGQYHKCNYFRQHFYISLRTGAFNMETGTLNNAHQLDRLALWYQDFSHFILSNSAHPTPIPRFIMGQ